MKQFSGKTVLITGHTGFKGSWLSVWMNYLGAKVIGLSVDIPTEPSNFKASEIGSFIEDYRVDIKDAEAVKKVVKTSQPDFIFHLAAQALVRPSYDSPLETIATNALGTTHVLDAIRHLEKKVVAVIITSDKVYDNLEWAWGYKETDRLGGKDPYSASKGMAELAIRTYVNSFFTKAHSKVNLGIARAGNVIGGGDWAVDRIVPDCIRAWSQGETVDIRNPDATRPWQHVLEPLSGYILLATVLNNRSTFHGEAYNFGPSAGLNHPVSQLIDEMSKYWKNITWNDVSKNYDHLHEAGLLKLNCDKALSDLKWLPTLTFKETVRMTIEWYKEFYHRIEQEDVVSMQSFTIDQLEEYTQMAKKKGMVWANN